MRSKKRNGFSMFEILTSVILLAVVSVSSYIFMPKLIDQAWDARRKSDIHKIKFYLENYFDDNGHYPDELPDCGSPSVPCDPVTGESYFYQVKGHEPDSYRIYANLTNPYDASIAKVGCQGGCGPRCDYNYGVSSANIGLMRCSFVCAPGGGKEGSCELFNDAEGSLCPKEYTEPTCQNECSKPSNRCQNASGKHIPF